MSGHLRSFDELDALLRRNRDVVAKTFRDRAQFSLISVFVLAAMQRLESNVDAMKLMVSSNNYPVACAILRMQIDTAMRVNGLRLMADPHDGIRKMLAGERYERIKPKHGDKLRDTVLLKALDEDHGWIRRVYDRVSGMVHLSGMHVHHALDHSQSSTDTDGALSIDLVISPSGPGVPSQLFDEVCEAFAHISVIGSKLIASRIEHEDQILNPPSRA